MKSDISAFPAAPGNGSRSALFPSQPDPTPRSFVQLLEPRTVVSDYSIIEPLGRGGVSTVYRAVDLDTGSDVALKILDSHFAQDPHFVERFTEEAETLAQMSHPNIVSLLAHGYHENNPWIAMEMVDGITLDQLIHTITLNSEQYLHLIREISQGLTYVHANGMLHGDIKPSNILVTRSGVVKIADFGIAHRLGTLALRDSMTGITRGTTHYMAPELFSDQDHIDYRADIYSLGVTFYKMFTRKLPVHPWKPASLLNHQLPDGIDAALATALQDDPERRYVTVNEFCETLAPLFGGEVTPTSTVTDRHDRPENQGKPIHASAIPAAKPVNEHVDWRLVGICLSAGLLVAIAILAVMFF